MKGLRLSDLTPDYIGAWFTVNVPDSYTKVLGKVQYLGSHEAGLPEIIVEWLDNQGHTDPTFTCRWYNFQHSQGEIRQFTEAFTELILDLVTI